jgi:hypothetical protein
LIRDKSKLIRYLVGIGICTVLGVAIAMFHMRGHWFSQAETQAERYRILCDAFTIPGVILVAVSALILVYNAGVFTGLSYGLRGMKDIFMPFLKQEYVPYREYRKKKMEKKVKGYSFIFFTGLAFLAVAIYFMIRFYSVYVPEYPAESFLPVLKLIQPAI